MSLESKKLSPLKAEKGVEETNSLCAPGLPFECDEKKLADIVEKNCGIRPINVKIVRDFQTKKSKGYGYIDFDTSENAILFLEHVAGEIFIDNTKVHLSLSRNINDQKDWICDVCKAQNFGFRKRCFKCSNQKSDACVELDEKIQRGLGASKLKAPSCELLIRGLSPQTIESNIHRACELLAPVVKVRLIRDYITKQSKCYGFVEFQSVEDATKAHKAINTRGVLIDGSKISCEFAQRLHLIGKELKSFYPKSYVHKTYEKPNERFDEKNIAVQGAKLREKAEAEGFTFDIQSGYYYNSLTNMHFDIKSGLYYCGEKGTWMKRCENDGEYEIVTEESMKEEKIKEMMEKKDEHPEKEEESLFGSFDISNKGKKKSWNDIINEKQNESKEESESIFGSFSIEKKVEKKPIKMEMLTYGASFKPNLKFQKMMEIVEANESSKELKSLQKKVQQKKNKLKRKHSEAFPNESKKENNFGRKLMKKMGWDGKGLGLKGNGMMNPLQVKIRDKRVGVGFSNYETIVGDNNKIKKTKIMKQRFINKK